MLVNILVCWCCIYSKYSLVESHCLFFSNQVYDDSVRVSYVTQSKALWDIATGNLYSSQCSPFITFSTLVLSGLMFQTILILFFCYLYFSYSIRHLLTSILATLEGTHTPMHILTINKPNILLSVSLWTFHVLPCSHMSLSFLFHTHKLTTKDDTTLLANSTPGLYDSPISQLFLHTSWHSLFR